MLTYEYRVCQIEHTLLYSSMNGKYQIYIYVLENYIYEYKETT